MIGIGIAWAGILAMPYAILAKSVEPNRMGVYMGIFNFTITIPQIFIRATGGLILKSIFNTFPVEMILLAGIFMLIASVCVFFVTGNQN